MLAGAMIARRHLTWGFLGAFLLAGGLPSCADYRSHKDRLTTDAGSQPTEDCTDGIDNDGNGLVDCADPACQASPLDP